MSSPRYILVVDDDPNMRQLLDIHLRGSGYEVRAAEDCIAAGKAVLERTPDMLIMDVHMPHMDGFEFVAALGEEQAYRNIPVIFLTSEEEGEQRARGLNAVGFVRKPVRADELLAIVARHLQP
jgi:DNA-binding response OmpR family regulator